MIDGELNSMLLPLHVSALFICLGCVFVIGRIVYSKFLGFRNEMVFVPGCPEDRFGHCRWDKFSFDTDGYIHPALRKEARPHFVGDPSHFLNNPNSAEYNGRVGIHAREHNI